MDDRRRAFLKKVAGRSLAVAGITAATVAITKDKSSLDRAWKYAKPRIKSFNPEATVYAHATGAGTFTLKGTT